MLAPLTDPFAEPSNLRALIEITLLGITGGAVGSWLVLNRLSYGAESLAHGMLPGLVGAALLGLPSLVGGAIGLLAAALAVACAGRISTLDQDTVIGVIVTALLGLGALLALSPETPAGLQGLLFGDILGVSSSDLVLAGLLAVIVVGALTFMHPRLIAAGFDRRYSEAIGNRVLITDGVLLVLLALTLLIAVQGLGNLLVVAVLIAPAAAARLITTRVAPMIGVSFGLAASAGTVGLVASYHLRIASGAAIASAYVLTFLLLAIARGRLT